MVGPRRRRKKRDDEPRSVSDILQTAYPGREPEDVRAIRAFAWWVRSVPDRVAANARPVRLSRGVLTVHAVSSVWASELHYLREQLLAALQRAAPEAHVKSIQIRVGELPPVPAHWRAGSERRPIEPVPLSELPEELARALSRITDDGVRHAVATAAATSLAPRESRPPGREDRAERRRS